QGKGGVAADHNAARKWLILAADQGEREAMLELQAEMRRGEIGKAAFDEMSRGWDAAFEQATEREIRQYAEGNDVPRDPIMADYLRRRADTRSANVFAALPKGPVEPPAPAVAVTGPAASMAKPLSLAEMWQVWLRREVYGGWRLDTLDARRPATRVVDRAAETGDPVAQDLLSYLYLNGIGEFQDESLAADWARKAVTLGSAPAKKRLGDILARQRNVVPGDGEILDWLRLAADLGNGAALTALGDLSFHGFDLNGLPVPADRISALALYRQAAEAKDPMGQYAMYGIYTKGIGVAIDATEAARWCRLAAEQKYRPALATMAELYRTGQGVTHDAAQMAHWQNVLQGEENRIRRRMAGPAPRPEP
ncbi:MAG: tetratricopeptide repeat protein, partial [Dongiaceae bacterium]